MTDVKKPFTVNDRRHFTAEGEAREDDSRPDEAAAQSPAVAREAPADNTMDREPRPGLDFAGLILSLGAQASLLLGMGGEEQEAPPDLGGAQAIISLLETLREKTEGRRTEDEDRVLQAILYELRMAYVSRARTGGA